ncbi:hypothetical protein [Oryzomicrobium sp.]|uniref:hypothetical protein n=2 Tax=Oryzomicrobium sp. TaxID=1911578 RepID=UPI0025F577D8|nr:hypothetical protein [Oryzomicrobium sp.]MCE1243811.1 hypothetical protein [Oryzomicrobium sp.]
MAGRPAARRADPPASDSPPETPPAADTQAGDAPKSRCTHPMRLPRPELLGIALGLLAWEWLDTGENEALQVAVIGVVIALAVMVYRKWKE